MGEVNLVGGERGLTKSRLRAETPAEEGQLVAVMPALNAFQVAGEVPPFGLIIQVGSMIYRKCEAAWCKGSGELIFARHFIDAQCGWKALFGNRTSPEPNPKGQESKKYQKDREIAPHA